jgi:hypothetical protein
MTILIIKFKMCYGDETLTFGDKLIIKTATYAIIGVASAALYEYGFLKIANRQLDCEDRKNINWSVLGSASTIIGITLSTGAVMTGIPIIGLYAGVSFYLNSK